MVVYYHLRFWRHWEEKEEMKKKPNKHAGTFHGITRFFIRRESFSQLNSNSHLHSLLFSVLDQMIQAVENTGSLQEASVQDSSNY